MANVIRSDVIPSRSLALVSSTRPDSGPTRPATFELVSELLGTFAVEESPHAKLLDRNREVVELRAALARERAARAEAEARDADKETFISVLGHDLLSPLQAILTTAQSMTKRGELGSSDQTALDRVTSSAVRIQRMIEQLADLARNRKSDFGVSKQAECDLVPLVAKIVHEVRARTPNCLVDFDEGSPCRAWVDSDRFEQVASNLIGNAIAHGDTGKPVSVVLETQQDRISLSVHNYGPPIEPDQLPHLFEPFKHYPHGKPRCGSAGLGLGLYIADCIVRAHGGRLQVASSAKAGTSFCAILPIQ